jgi:hypothetical protein
MIYGKSDNKHLVCTVSVYFHPSRTIGNMLEAMKFVAISLLFSLVVAMMSLATSALFLAEGWRLWGYLIDLVVFCGGGLGIIAYAKQWVNKQTFNTACSLASIFLVTILTKEGNIQAGRFYFGKLFQSFMFVFSGAALAFFMCLALWPVRAESELKKALNKSTKVYGSALAFALEKLLRCEQVEHSEFEKFTSDINSCYENTKKFLHDASHELLACGRESELALLERLVMSSQRLGLHLSGLVSSCDIQWNLLSSLVENDSSSASSAHTSARKCSTRAEGSAPATYGAVGDTNAATCMTSVDNEPPYELLREFLYYLGPPMNSFVSTMRRMLNNLPFDETPRHRVSLHNQYRNSLKLACDLYSTAREEALTKLYSQDSFKDVPEFDEAVLEEAVAASCGNFSYVLEDLGDELKVFLDTLDEYAALTEGSPPKVRY